MSIEESITSAKIVSIHAETHLDSDHYLSLGIYRTMPDPKSGLSPKIFPLVVELYERNRAKDYTDIYSFDNNGELLSHGYSLSNNEIMIHDEQHDLCLDRLIKHGETIKEMIGKYTLPNELAQHVTVLDLKSNLLGKRNLERVKQEYIQ